MRRSIHSLCLGAAVLLIVSKSYGAVNQAKYDTAPVDWEYYQHMWLKDFSRALSTEPRLSAYDATKAAEFLDDVALRWTRQNKCGTCHTNLPYLMARPFIADPAGASAMEEVRSSLLADATERMSKPKDRYTIFGLAPLASAVVIHDARRSSVMDPTIAKIFDLLWTLQDPDGSWSYPTDGFLPLLERDRRYLAMQVALAVGYAPDRYYNSPAAKPGVEKLRSLLRGNLPDSAHDRAYLLWASVRTPGLLSSAEQAHYRADLLKLQNKDGGWTLPALGNWPRHDGAPNDPRGPSDGYATGLVTLALCESGNKDAASIQRAIDWIKQNQRVSGRWFTRSTYSDRFYNYVSNMGTAYAVMALASSNAM